MEANPCIYKKVDKVLDGGKIKLKHSIRALYVDDLLVACSIKTMCKNLEASFQVKFKMMILGGVRHILSVDVHSSLEHHLVHLFRKKSSIKLPKTQKKHNNNSHMGPYGLKKTHAIHTNSNS